VHHEHAKGAAIVEEAVVEFVREQVLTPAAVKRLAEQAKRLAEREAARPPADVAPLEAQVADLVRRRSRLIALAAGDESAELGPVREQIVALGRQIKPLQEQVREARRQAAGPVPLLTAADVWEHLADLRGLLAEEPAAVGLALRSITVSHERYGPGERYGGAKGGRWVLTFTPRLAPALAARAGERPA
jgi:hypothetical protein